MKNLFTLLFVLSVSASAFSQSVMTPELLWKLGRLGSPVLSEDGKEMYFTVRYYNLDSNKGQSQIFSMPIGGGQATQMTNLSGGLGNLMLGPNGKLNYVSNGSLWSLEGQNKSTKITTLMKSSTNLSYSSTFDKLLCTMDLRIGKNLADDYHNYKKANVKIYDDLMFRHWSNWNNGYISHPILFDVINGKPNIKDLDGSYIDIMQSEPFDVPMKPFGGAEDLTWNPNGKEVVYQCKKKSGIEYAKSTNSDLYSYNTETRETKNITEGRMGYDSSPLYNGKGTKLAWLSMARDGYESDKNDIIIRDLASGSDVNLTEKWNNTVSSYTWSKSGKKIYFLATINATYQIFEITLPKKLESIDPNTHFRQITQGQFNYRSMLESGETILALRQDMNNASEIYSVDIKTGTATQLSHVNDELYGGIKRGNVEKRIIKTSDGKDMLTWIIYPPDFDPKSHIPPFCIAKVGHKVLFLNFTLFVGTFN